MFATQPEPYTIEDFHFWVPIEKAESPVDSNSGQEVRRIRGVASTEDKDLQGEIIHQRGLDFSYFLKHGYFNNDHKSGFINKIGEPTKAEIRNGQFWVEGFLYNDHPVADEVWELMHSQEKTPHARRKVGFSVQGKVKRRMGKQILECWVQDVAITPAPINTKTWAEIAKSFQDAEWADPETVERALIAGYAISNQTGGSALRPESLDSDQHNLSYDDSIPSRKKKAEKTLSKEEAIRFLQLHKGYSRTTSRLIVDAHFSGLV